MEYITCIFQCLHIKLKKKQTSLVNCNIKLDLAIFMNIHFAFLLNAMKKISAHDANVEYTELVLITHSRIGPFCLLFKSSFNYL